jgi:beta-galactosidase/beta-glucuronidase
MNKTERKNSPRLEYPRPQFGRDNNWINLNGEWDFAFDDSNRGLKEKWYRRDSRRNFDKKIIVPYCFQSKLSGIGDTSFHDIIWYRREFIIPNRFQNHKVVLHFGAVDYNCIVYLNGERIGAHEGGYIGFSLDITDFIQEINLLILRVEDPSQDLNIPRGKQYWQRNLETIFYPRVSGIWQTVWLEFLPSEYHLNRIKFIPDIDLSEIMIEFHIHGSSFSDIFLNFQIFFDGKEITTEEITLDFLGKNIFRRVKKAQNKNVIPKTPNCFKFKASIPRDSLHLWDVEHPNLYDINFKIYNKKINTTYDLVRSYFGMRKISLSDKKTSQTRQVLLNNKPIYQKLFLVQGYWPDGLYTAPSDEAIKQDIQFIKDFGFNGLRTHQKTFDPRFLYWCDKMGVLVWGEIGNAYRFNVESQMLLLNEFVREIERDFNHPSIIVWTPINEGWGIQGAEKDLKREFYIKSLYNLIKSIDPYRLVIDNDGWWHTESNDICTRHYYGRVDRLPKSMKEEKKLYKNSVPQIYLNNNDYDDEPIIYSEMGGFGFDANETIENSWGYGKSLNSPDDLLDKVIQLLKEFDERKEWIQGFCYTELYDQFQEVNGLLTMNRDPKFPPSKLKEQLDQMFI